MNSLNILILAFGTQGDVQPYLALGGALKQAGHHVRLLTHQSYAPVAAILGLDFWPVQGNVQEAMQDPDLRKVIETGNIIKINQHTAKLVQEAALEWAQVGVQAAQGMQLLLAGIGGLSLARNLEEKLHIPLIEAHVVPFHPTTAFPGALFPASGGNSFGAFNLLTHHVVKQVMWQGFRAGDQKVRQAVLGLPASPFWGPRKVNHRVQPPVIHGISPSVLPRPRDWPAHVHMAGYWLLDPQRDWQPPEDLKRFLDAGEKPFYIGFGSMGNRDPEATAELVLGALQRTGQRAVLLKGWGGMFKGQAPDHVFFSDAIPHTWLFPRMRAVVHHGGAGTTAAGLRAGVPNAVVPFFGDQPFWGHRVQQLGVGPAPMPRKTLTADQLTRAIETVLGQPSMTEKARTLGKKIQAEQGLQDTIGVIERYAKQL